MHFLSTLKNLIGTSIFGLYLISLLVTPAFSAEVLTEQFDIMGVKELSFDRNVLEKVVDDLALINPNLSNKFKKPYWNNQPVFIFIPGILGSKLIDSDGNVIWGKESLDDIISQKKDLRFRENQKINSQFLETFEFLGYEINIYKDFFEEVQLMNLSDIEHLKTFSYDWRKDIQDVAKDFDDTLFLPEWQKDLKERNIILVAHSMGGLVTKWWYNKHYLSNPAKYFFADIPEIIFLGTPHNGAPSALLTLSKGYSFKSNSNWFYRAVENKVFRNLNLAAYTFPSVYQLLPYDNFVMEKKQGKEKLYPVDHFSIKPWIRYDWLQNARKSENEEINLFYRNIKGLLINGENFQYEIRQFPTIACATYFYSDSLSTPSKIVMVTNNGKNLKDKTENEDGDGRVTASIAKNWKRIQNAKACHHLSGAHGSLPKCDGFISYIEDLREQYTIKSNIELKNTIYENSTIIAAMVKNGALLEMPIRKENLFNPEIKNILEFNSKILELSMAKEKKDEELWLYAYGKGRVADTLGDWKNAKQFYALSLGLNPESNRALYAANNLGFIMMKIDKNTIAKNYCEFALKSLPDKAKGNVDTEYLGRVHNNLGVINWKLGSHDKSAYHWNKAVEIGGSQKAIQNLEMLKTSRVSLDYDY